MRFAVMHKHDKTTEAGGRPSADFIGKMGALVGGMIQQGVFKDGAGLGKSATRTRLTFQNGARAVLEGPYRGSDHELVASLMQITVKSRAEAVDWASQLGKVLGDVEIEVGKTTEAWDLGLAPEPPNPPLHYLVLVKATKDSEAGKQPSASVRAAVDEVKQKMRAAGVLTSEAALAPSKRALRIHMDRSGKKSIVDGPFTESKELIGGFSLLELPSREAVVDFAWRYGALMLESVEAVEIDIRPAVDE
jgi:hypothetical protein